MNDENMKKRFYFLATVLIFAFAVSASAQTTQFTYQGKLTDTGTPTATYDFEFHLCNSLAADCTVPLAAQQIPNVPVSGGTFTVKLDFGPANFDGSNRWLEIAVKHPAQGTYTTLSPRQPLTSAPYSIRSLKSFDAENLGGVPAGSYLQTNGDGSALTNLNAVSVASGTLSDARLSSNVAKLDTNNVFTGGNNLFPQITMSGSGQIIAPRIENAASDPVLANATNAGRLYFNTTDKEVKVSNGTAWISLTPQPRQLQTFSAAGTSTQISCGSNIRSISFNKVSTLTRLRITYKDEFAVLSAASFSAFRVEVRIDNATTSPVSMTNQFGVSCSGGLCSGGEDETFVGYANGIAAGTHTFTSLYTGFISGSPICYRPAKYLVEIEEVP